MGHRSFSSLIQEPELVNNEESAHTHLYCVKGVTLKHYLT